MKWNVVRLGQVTSTQEVAKVHAPSGGPPGLVIVAEAQTDGRGRRGRRWHSPRGGLYLTAVLRPTGRVGLLPIMAGVAVAEAIEAVAGVEAALKWPNDILVGGRKVGGVIAETVWSGEEVKFALLGIGVNVNNPPLGDIPDATSISMELGEDVDIELLLSCLLERLDHHLPYLKTEPSRILQSWRRHSETLGKRVTVAMDSGETVEGLAIDIDPDGALILETESGRRKIVAGSLERRYS